MSATALLPESRRSYLLDRLKAELSPERLLPGLLAGMVSGTLTIVLGISFAALIFSGPLSEHLSVGVGVALLAATVLATITGLRSSLPSAIAIPQDTVAAILALMAASLVQRQPPLGSAQLLPTILAAIAVSALVTGLSLLALGKARLGRLIRYLPYPVVGGFLAGTGWLLVRGSLGVLVDVSPTPQHLPLLLSGEALPRWLSGAAFGLVLVAAVRRVKRPWVIPLAVLSALGLFYFALLAFGVSPSLARQQGWLLDPGTQTSLWLGVALMDPSQVHWGAVFSEIGNIGAVVVFSAVSLLLNATAIELETGLDADVDRELQAAGLANLVSGAVGGMAGYHALSLTVLGHRLGARGHVAGLVVAALSALALMFGPAVVAFFPRPLLGGLLLFLGAYFLVEWVYDAWFKLPRTDYALVLLIFLVVAFWGFLQGVAIGLLIAIVLFVVNYSHLGVVKHTLSGATYWSNVDRPAEHRAVLQEKGDQEHILKLHNFLFFGTANTLLQLIAARVADATRLPARFIVLDFRQVSGIDSSAALAFSRLRQVSERDGFTLVFAGLSPTIRGQLRNAGYDAEAGPCYRIFASLDYALEWCEDQILAAGGAAGDGRVPLQRYLEEGLGEGAATVLARYLDRLEVRAGEYVVRQGDRSDDLYFLERGSLTVLLDLGEGQQMRLRRMLAESIIGEIGLYLGKARTASVVADEDCVVYRLRREAVALLTDEQPVVAARFHEFAARMLADRLEKNTRMVEALLR